MASTNAPKAVQIALGVLAEEAARQSFRVPRCSRIHCQLSSYMPWRPRAPLRSRAIESIGVDIAAARSSAAVANRAWMSSPDGSEMWPKAAQLYARLVLLA
jgi:hypothetical protein